MFIIINTIICLYLSCFLFYWTLLIIKYLLIIWPKRNSVVLIGWLLRYIKMRREWLYLCILNIDYSLIVYYILLFCFLCLFIYFINRLMMYLLMLLFLLLILILCVFYLCITDTDWSICCVWILTIYLTHINYCFVSINFCLFF